MSPFFLITQPRAGGSALARLLDADPSTTCAGESFDFLERLFQMRQWPDAIPAGHGGQGWDRIMMTPDRWSPPVDVMLRQWTGAGEGLLNYGVRSSYFGHLDWRQAVGRWSWLLESFPGSRIVFLSRQPDDEQELSLVETWPLWRPSFGECHGSVFTRARLMRDSFEDFQAMNPGRTMHVDMAELADFVVLSAKLAKVGLAIGEDPWRQMNQDRPGNRRAVRKEINRIIEDRAAEESFAKAAEEPVGGWVLGEGAPNPFAAEQVAANAKLKRRLEKQQIPMAKVFRPDFPPVAAPLKLEVHTLRFGRPDWMRDCSASLESWCVRHGYPLHVSGVNPAYPEAKFCEVDMLRQFLAGDAEFMFYVDADVFVHPAAPAPDFLSVGGFHVMADVPLKRVSGAWPAWMIEHFPSIDPFAWTYRNAGVWACDRAAAAAMLNVISEPYISGHQEQHQFNAWLAMAALNGMPVRDLAPEWNRFPGHYPGPGWFFHFAGRDKLDRLAEVRRAGYLPAVPEAFPHQESIGTRGVCWLWKKEAARWDELRHSLRSVLANLTESPPFHIFGDERPDWLEDHPAVTFHLAPGYPEAIARAVQVADEVLLFNDDIFLLTPHTWDDFREALYRGGDLVREIRQNLACSNGWRRGVGRATLSLYHHGHASVRDFSTHTPYLFERAKALETLRRHGCWRKMPFETLYHTDHATPCRRMSGDKTSSLPSAARFLNHGNSPPERALRDRLAGLFAPAPWERATQHGLPGPPFHFSSGQFVMTDAPGGDRR
jgi:hypothetical protein